MATITISNNTGATYSGVVDTWIQQTNPTENKNSEIDLVVSQWTTADRRHALIKFGGLSSVASGGVVSNAKVRLRCTAKGANPSTIQLRKLLRAFTDSQATWNIAQTSVNWGTAGALNATTDYDPSLLAQATVVVGSYAELTGSLVDAYVQSVIDTGTDNGLVLFNSFFNSGSDNFTTATVSSSVGTDGQRPELVFDYAVGSTYNVTQTETINSSQTSTAIALRLGSLVEAATASQVSNGANAILVTISESASASQISTSANPNPKSIIETATANDVSESVASLNESIDETVVADDEYSLVVFRFITVAINEIAAAVDSINASIFTKLKERLFGGSLTQRHPEE